MFDGKTTKTESELWAEIERLRTENTALRAGLKAHWGDSFDARLAYVLKQQADSRAHEQTVECIQCGEKVTFGACCPKCGKPTDE